MTIRSVSPLAGSMVNITPARVGGDLALDDDGDVHPAPGEPARGAVVHGAAAEQRRPAAAHGVDRPRLRRGRSGTSRSCRRRTPRPCPRRWPTSARRRARRPRRPPACVGGGDRLAQPVGHRAPLDDRARPGRGRVRAPRCPRRRRRPAARGQLRAQAALVAEGGVGGRPDDEPGRHGHARRGQLAEVGALAAGERRRRRARARRTAAPHPSRAGRRPGEPCLRPPRAGRGRVRRRRPSCGYLRGAVAATAVWMPRPGSAERTSPAPPSR